MGTTKCGKGNLMKKVILISLIVSCMSVSGYMQDTTSSKAAPQSRKSLRTLVGDAKASTDPKERVRVRMQISAYNPQNVSEVKDLLDVAEAEEKGGDIQKDVLGALNHVNDPTMGPVFYERMKKKSSDPYVRAVSIGKLGGLKYKEAVPDMIKLVDDFDYEKGRLKDESVVPLAAFFALGQIGDERAIPAVMRKLGKMGSQDSQVIAKFGNKVLPQLMEKAKTSKDKQEKEAAYVTINAIKDEKAVPTLWSTLKEEKATRLRSACAGALLSTLTDTTTPTRKQLTDYIFQEAQKDTEIFGMGYYAVVLARDNKDTDYLIRVLRDEKSLRNLRTDAIVALGNLKAQSAVPVLEDVLKWPDREFRMEASSALKKITGKEYNGGVK